MGRKRLRMVERRKTVGLSQENLAEVMAVETSTVARWERGETTPHPWHRPRLADALKVSVEQVAAMLSEADEPGTPESSPISAGPVVEARGLKLPLGGLAAALLRPDAAGAAPANVETLAARGREAWRLRQLAGYDALAELLPSLIAQIEASAATVHHADWEQVVRVAVHTYNTASSLLKTAGDYHLGLVAADRAARLARTLDDPQLIAAALYRVANVLLGARRLTEAVNVAVRAADVAEPGARRASRGISMWGGPLLTAAVASARAGQECEAWQFLGEARAVSRMLASDHADMYCIFGPTNLAIHGVQVAVELGNGHDALRRGQSIDHQDFPGALRERRGQYLIDVAHAHVLRRDDPAAVATLQEAHQVAPQEVQLNGTAQALLGRMLGRAPAGSTGGLRELADAIGYQDTA